MSSLKNSKKITTFFLFQILIVTFIFVNFTNSKKIDIYNSFDRELYEGTFVWSTAQVISNESSLMSIRPVITTDPFDNVHIVWQDMTDLGGIGTDDDIFYKILNATTHAWSIITVLSPSGMEPSVGPEITADGLGNVHVIWRDKTDILGAGSDTDIFYYHWNKTTDS